VTDQIADKLINQCPDVDFEGLSLRAIIRGNPDSGNEERLRFNRKPKQVRAMCSALLRGYIGSFLLSKDGRLTLIRYEYPFCEQTEDESFEEEINGDFWMAMKARKTRERVFVPFRSSKIVADKTSWITQAPRKLPTGNFFKDSN